MIKLQKLTKTSQKAKKRVGRGYGSGKGGHTAGRGAKGKKARGRVALYFTGTKAKKSFITRLPLQRGKGKLKPKQKPEIISLDDLAVFKKGEIVSLESLVKKGVVSKKALRVGVKILNKGKLDKSLKIKVPHSRAVEKKLKSEEAAAK